MEAKIIAAKCRNGKSFGIRIEKRKRDWLRTWAFPMTERTLEREKYIQEDLVSGSLDPTEEYPGCPYCGTDAFFLCGACKHLNCWGGEENEVCKWCGRSCRISIGTKFELNSGEM